MSLLLEQEKRTMFGWWKQLGAPRKSRRVVRPRKRTLRFDILEDRRVLSGNVTSSPAVGPSLVLTGDAANNAIGIIGTSTPGTFRVYSVDGTTKIDGQLS